MPLIPHAWKGRHIRSFSHTKTPPPSSPLPSGVDPALIQRLLPLLSQMNRAESSETTAFLLALRPFLKPERRDKVERAAQLARVIHLAKLFLLSQEG